jgi:hypothetical protein
MNAGPKTPTVLEGMGKRLVLVFEVVFCILFWLV